MNHLRDLVDSGTFGMYGASDRHHAHYISEMILEAGKSAQCFWIGDFDQSTGLKEIPELCRLPFQCCWFESTDSLAGLHFGVIVHEVVVNDRIAGLTPSNGVSSLHFAKVRHEGWVFICGLTYKGGYRREQPTVFSSASDHAEARAVLNDLQVCKFLSAMNCSNVKRREHVPDAALQRARAKRGKQPLFSYWTLELDGKSERGPDQGGTHASPRVHLRRGHPRQYAEGKWTWVQPCAVGRRELGMVHKDYAVGKQLIDMAVAS